MIGLTGGHICPLCGYRLPVQTITYTTGTEKYGEYVEVVRCKDCKWGREACGNIECHVDLNIPSEYHGYDWYCPNGERKEECSR